MTSHVAVHAPRVPRRQRGYTHDAVGARGGHRRRAGRRGTDRDRRARRRGRRRRRLQALPEPPDLDHGAGRAGRRLGHDRPRVPGRVARRRSSTTASRSTTSTAPAARSGSPSSSRRTRGDPYQLMMTGLVMLGAIETNKTDVGLDETTPIATMITETEAIVVPTKSKLPHAQRPHRRLQGRPGSIRWAGGSAGGTDQLLVGELARVLGGRSGEDEVRRALRRRRGQRRDPLRLRRRRRDRPVGGRRPGRGRARCACSRSPRP